MKFLKCFIWYLILLTTANAFSIFSKKEFIKEKIVSQGTKTDIKSKSKDKTKNNAIRIENNHKNGFVPSQNKFTAFEKCDPCPKNVKCVPAIQCPAHLRMDKHPQLCDLPGKGKMHGLCCTSKQNHTSKDFHKHSSSPRHFSHSFFENIFHEASHEFNTVMNDQGHHHQQQSHHPPKEHIFEPDFFHHAMFSSHNPHDLVDVSNLFNSGVKQMMASKVFKDKNQLTVEESQLNQFDVSFAGSAFDKTCPIRPHCSFSAKYRTYDGTCNHLLGRETWGAAKTPMERLLPPAYEDGIWSARLKAHDGTRLKSARTISRLLFDDADRPHPYLNLMVMQFGQFISHDITQSSSITLPDGGRIKCCSDDGSQVLPPQKSHFACMPIFIDENDQFYRQFHQRCMNFVRLSIAPDHNCQMGYAKTLSKVTHFIDGSAIYGSDERMMTELRSFQNGQLKMFMDFNRPLLPMNPRSDDCVVRNFACFLAGDVRVNQHITLVAIHLLFAREHNRIAEVLHKINSDWNDEILFEEARKIVIAKIQHIAYNEWLPLIIGKEAMIRFSLLSNQNGYSIDYDDEINPSMTNEFTGAAFRFGHSTVQGKLFVEFNHKLDEIIPLQETFNNPGRMRFQHFYDEIMRTLVHEPMQSVDDSVTFGLSRFLFNSGNPFGLDLVSLNIQRGRDEALRPYNDYLAVSGNKIIEDFHEFGPVIGERLEQVYNSPSDIDLFVGGLLESSDGEATVGPTFREIIADQFSRLKKGDRYFYENSPDINPGHFNEKQLDEIRKITLARIICDNSDKIALTTQSPHAFIQSNLEENEPVNCDSSKIPSIDLLAWKA